MVAQRLAHRPPGLARRLVDEPQPALEPPGVPQVVVGALEALLRGDDQDEQGHQHGHDHRGLPAPRRPGDEPGQHCRLGRVRGCRVATSHLI